MALRDAWTALLRREVKASRAGPLIALQHPGRAVWSPRRFDAFAQEAYAKNVIAFRAINQVSRAAASVPWRLTRRRGGALERLAAHPLLDLIARPNPMMARSEFIEAVTGFYLIAGNAFIEAAPGTAEPRELWLLRPDRMKVVAGKTGLPKGFVFTLAGAERRWDADPVTGRSPILHLKTFHPLDDWYGLSPVEPAGSAIDQRNESDKWNMALLQNGARPSGALVYEPRDGAAANLTDEQFARLRQEIASQYGGAKNAGRPMLLDGGLRWQEMSLSPKDMDFLDIRHAASRDIAQAFGVPPQLLGIPGDSTYSNYQEARLALWEETVIPLLRHLCDAFNAWLAPHFGEGLAFDLDLDQIPALTLRRERTWARLQDAEFLTLNEKRETVGLPPRPDGDVLPPPRARRPAREEPRDDS
ncbi:MAG: phage portal protein [Proteobacteria bacterium]|nr:phage portal protein [Pseudomonadota bacterium]